MDDYNNVHYFILHQHLVTDEMTKHFDHYLDHDKVKLLQCDPNENLPHCESDLPLHLVMNTIKIDFNGHEEHPNGKRYSYFLDIKKWIQYRINEHPDRMNWIDDLKE